MSLFFLDNKTKIQIKHIIFFQHCPQPKREHIGSSGERRGVGDLFIVLLTSQTKASPCYSWQEMLNNASDRLSRRDAALQASLTSLWLDAVFWCWTHCDFCVNHRRPFRTSYSLQLLTQPLINTLTDTDRWLTWLFCCILSCVYNWAETLAEAIDPSERAATQQENIDVAAVRRTGLHRRWQLRLPRCAFPAEVLTNVAGAPEEWAPFVPFAHH